MPTKKTPAKKSTRGGKREGAGRPTIKAGEPSIVTSIRLPESLHTKYMALGGGEWLRDKIKRAKVKA